MTPPTTLRVHLWCMTLLRQLEAADPGRPIGAYFAGAQRYVQSRMDDARALGDADAPHWVGALRHLKAGCPTPPDARQLGQLLNVHA